MAKSTRVRVNDVAAILELLGQVHELPGGFHDRARLLINGLRRLVSARVGLACDLRNYTGAGSWRMTLLLDEGWESQDERQWNLAFFEGAQLDDPMTAPCAGLLEVVATRTRPQLVSDHDWYRSSNVNELRRRARIDHCIYSNYRLDASGHAIGLAFHRAWGDRPFTSRDVAIVDLVHRAQRLYRPSAAPSDLGAGPLPLRQREVLAGFQVGLAEKQVARRLGISVHTVHVYAKSLYRHFHVNSRAELLGLLLNGRSSGPGRTG